MNILLILAAIASGGVCHLHSDHQYSTEPTVYIQESTEPPKVVNQYTTVSSLGVPSAHYTQGSSSFGSHVSYPNTYTGSAKTFGAAKSISSFPSYTSFSNSYQPSVQNAFPKPYSSYITAPTYSTTVSPTYSTVFSTPKSSIFNSGLYSTQATPTSSYSSSYSTPTVSTYTSTYPSYGTYKSGVYSTPATSISSYPASYSAPTVSTYSSSYPSFGTSKSTVSYPAYSSSVVSSSPFAKAYSTPATVTTSYPSVSAFKSTFTPNYNVYSTSSPQVYKDSSKSVVTSYSSPSLWSSQGTAQGFASNLNSPVTIQKSTFTPVKPTLTAYSAPVTLAPSTGQYFTAIKNQDSQYSTSYSPAVNVVGKTVYTKPAYNTYSSISSAPISYSAPVSWSSYPSVQTVIEPAVSSYSSPVSSTSHGSAYTYKVQPSAFTYSLQNAPLTREYHSLEDPHSWKTSNTWSSVPVYQQTYITSADGSYWN